MRVLVTGGTGVIGKAAVDALLRRGHAVRLVAREAPRAAAQWAGRVEPHAGAVEVEDEVRDAASGCDAILHVAGIMAEEPPESTFQAVNVEGTRHLLREADRAGVRRFVLVSDLGAEQESSAYLRSKREAERLVEAWGGSWLILRPGLVYGPGDRSIAVLLKMVRALPAIPMLVEGDRPFQPLWAEDLAEGLARALESGGPERTIVEVAGDEVTTVHEVLDRLGELTGRRPSRVPVPQWLGRLGLGLASGAASLRADQLVALGEEVGLAPQRSQAHDRLFPGPLTPLGEGLARLAADLPESSLSDGLGSLQLQRYWADIEGSALSQAALLEEVRRDFYDLPPERLLRVGVEPGDAGVVEVGHALSMALPLRGNIQVRVEEISREAVTLVTLEGHPLTGVIRFLVQERPEGKIRFEIRSYTRAADALDLLAMKIVGHAAQAAVWQAVVREVVRRSGGEAPDGVQSASAALEPPAAARIERWAEELVMRRRREESARSA